jgi:hypothetical protein
MVQAPKIIHGFINLICITLFSNCVRMMFLLALINFCYFLQIIFNKKLISFGFGFFSWPVI